ncbi:MAG TPA: uroporphyrinogen decarboxylase family protein [bacterium]|nr:uroporphyrinogen decarboxylase family protein [bacterium]
MTEHLDNFRRLCVHDPSARPPRWESLGFWSQTVERWRGEGLPEHLSPEEYFEMHPRAYLPGSSGFTGLPLYPEFEKEILSEDQNTVTYRSGNGIVLRELKVHSELSMPQWLEFPVKNRADWDSFKERLDLRTRPLPTKEEIEQEVDFRYPVAFTFCGFYGAPRNLFGEENLSYAYYDQPGLIHDILEYWLAYCKENVRRIAGLVRIDYVLIWEDMSYKTAPLISPATFREFMSPYYRELVDYVRDLSIERIMVDSDGNNDVLMDLFLDAGVNIMMPFEIAADQCPLRMRDLYGDRLVILGGIDKRAIAQGRDAIRAEVLGKVPELLRRGGYIPCIDHSCPPDISFDNWRYFVDLVRECVERQVGL